MDSAEEIVWKESFFKENFNVDNCLSKYTLKSDLETLRNDLKKYGNELHQQMAEILKTETEAIVNLAEYLTNLNSKIDDLSLPISQLREEIKTLYELIKSAQKSFCNTLESIKNNNNRRNYLNLKFGIITSALYIDEMMKSHDDLFHDSVILERAVNKYSFDFNYLEAFGLATDIEEISFVGKKLTELVNKIFLKSINSNDQEVILRCLRMYDNLGQQKEAEKTYQIHVIRPNLKHLFTESYLETCNQDVSRIYEEAFSFIDSKLINLLNVLKKNSELKSFNFILNSFWVEVDKLSREGLPYITAPGNPELFQKRFKSTWSFLLKVAQKCGDESLIYANSTFQNHIKRFNLPVYFEIRFQQIAGQFESDAVLKPGNKIFTNESNDQLKITLAFQKALKLAFNSEVFIDNLADQFLKLSMLLMARYLKWFDLALEECSTFCEGPEAWEDFIITSINDLNLVKNLIGNSSNIDSTVYSIMPENMKLIIVNVFNLNSDLISQSIQKLQNHLITMKSNDSLSHLQTVAAIPRLYRRTNRNVPKEPSNYIIEALQPILKFHAKFKIDMKEEIQVIVDAVIANNTKQYQSLVEEVLRSVCKTEESLRRLKNRNTQVSETVSDPESSETMSDEMKIREQIKLDVCYFVDKMYPLSGVNSRKSLDELKKQTC